MIIYEKILNYLETKYYIFYHHGFLTLYSGQFSPRTLNDFLQRKILLNILGYFIEVSVYSIISLVLTANYVNFNFAIFTLLAMTFFLFEIILFT
ncbi:MAG: DUF2254 family protein [Candidatus Izemoplasmatales bacterium]|nr:DUF2254 family protein [Candidatus Izemoplasmatales bacterium]